MDISNFNIAKGFLAQAKIAGKNEIKIEQDHTYYPKVLVNRPKNDYDNPTSLYSQCNQMLQFTPDSFVFIYSQYGIMVMPASSIVSLPTESRNNNIFALPLRLFMTNFFNSFIGDLKISAFDDETLRDVRSTFVANSAMLLQVSQSN